MKHPLNEIKRLQQLAGLNEWKVSPAPPAILYYNRALEVVESYEDEDILEDFKNEFPENQLITEKKWFEWNAQYLGDNSDWFYVKQHWKYITTGDESVYDELLEWKIQQQPVIDPENLDDFGYHDSYLNEFVIEPDPHKYANWLDRYFPGWENNLDIETTGAKAFRSAIKKAIISKYGDQVKRIYIGV